VSAESASLAGECLRALRLARARLAVAVLLLLGAVATAAGLAGRPQPEPPPARKAPSPAAERPRPAGPLGELSAWGAVRAVALSPDGKALATSGDHPPHAQLWDVATRRARAGLKRPMGLASDSSNAECVCFSPDGKVLATGSRTLAWGGIVTLWGAARGELKSTLKSAGASVYALGFSPDGQLLAGGAGASPIDFDRTIRWHFADIPKDPALYKEYGEVKVWALASGETRTFFRGGGGRILSVCFSPDGKALAAGGRYGAIRLFDVASGKERACLREGNAPVKCVAFSPDGKTLASAHEGLGIRLWSVPSGRVRARLPGRGARGLAYSPDGRTLVTAANVPPPGTENWERATGEVRLWDAATGRPSGAPLPLTHRADALAFGARGMVLAVGGQRDRTVGGQRDRDQGVVTLLRLGPPGGKASP
jgi:WD40 repeat protein